jgi:hypothetical protein
MCRKAEGLPYQLIVIKPYLVIDPVKWSGYRFDGSTRVNSDQLRFDCVSKSLIFLILISIIDNVFYDELIHKRS